jgi:uncharacterized protein
MAPSVLALIGATIVFTSFLSGVFGMAGGMILLGVLLNYFDVATGMITNATKAVAQSFSHVVRMLYFGSLSGVGDLPMWTTAPAILLAIGGTSLAPFVLERMTDHGFRRWTRTIIFAISAVYLARAGWLFFNR